MYIEFKQCDLFNFKYCKRKVQAGKLALSGILALSIQERLNEPCALFQQQMLRFKPRSWLVQ